MNGKCITRLSKYFVWFLVNFVICLGPIAISLIIAQALTDSIISSYISYAYTLLVSSLYLYKTHGKDSEPLFWITQVVITFFLVGYLLFPGLLSEDMNCYMRDNFITISVISLSVVIIISLFLNYRSIEELVEKALNEEKMREAENTENRVKDFMSKLKTREK